MNKKRFVGLTLVVISGVISFLKMKITGGVIGTGEVDRFSFLSLLAFLFGFFLLAFSKEGGGTRKIKDITSILEECGRDGTKKIILDSSGVIQNKNSMPNLLKGFKGEVYASTEVIKELGSYTRRRRDNIVMQDYWKKNVKMINKRAPGFDREGYAGDLRTAREYIQDSRKHKVWKALKPYFEGKVKNRKAIEKEYGKEIYKIRERARGFGGDRADDKQCLKELNKRWRASSGDIRVLADALHLAYANLDQKNRERVKILGNDAHIGEAVKELRKDKPDLEDYLSYEDGSMAA